MIETNDLTITRSAKRRRVTRERIEAHSTLTYMIFATTNKKPIIVSKHKWLGKADTSRANETWTHRVS